MPVFDINDINSSSQSTENTDCRDGSSRETHDVVLWLDLEFVDEAGVSG